MDFLSVCKPSVNAFSAEFSFPADRSVRVPHCKLLLRVYMLLYRESMTEQFELTLFDDSGEQPVLTVKVDYN